MVTPRNLIDVFHCIVDLPLVALAYDITQSPAVP
jgi:hypothetical protein